MPQLIAQGTEKESATMSSSMKNGQGNGAGEKPSVKAQAGMDPGRDARGRFQKGNPGGPGNPHAREMARMREVICSVVSEEDLADIARTMRAKALCGNL